MKKGLLIGVLICGILSGQLLVAKEKSPQCRVTPGHWRYDAFKKEDLPDQFPAGSFLFPCAFDASGECLPGPFLVSDGGKEIDLHKLFYPSWEERNKAPKIILKKQKPNQFVFSLFFSVDGQVRESQVTFTQKDGSSIEMSSLEENPGLGFYVYLRGQTKIIGWLSKFLKGQDDTSSLSFEGLGDGCQRTVSQWRYRFSVGRGNYEFVGSSDSQ